MEDILFEIRFFINKYILKKYRVPKWKLEAFKKISIWDSQKYDEKYSK